MLWNSKCQTIILSTKAYNAEIQSECEETGKEARERLAGTSTMNHGGLPRLTVSLTRPPSSSSRRVSADSLEVVAMSRPYARWDMKRSATSSASVCMVTGMMIFRYMLPS